MILRGLSASSLLPLPRKVCQRLFFFCCLLPNPLGARPAEPQDDPIIEKSQEQDQGQGQGQGQDQKWQQRSALRQQMVLALTLTLVLALVRNIIIFSKVRVLVLNQPKNDHETDI